jgi:hypothetical protein
MKPKRESITVHLRKATRRIDRAANVVCDGMISLHCARVLALSRGKTRNIRKLFFSDTVALEDRAVVLERNLRPEDRQQAIRSAQYGAEIEKLYEMARRLRARLESCYIRVKRYNLRVRAEEIKESFEKAVGGLSA